MLGLSGNNVNYIALSQRTDAIYSPDCSDKLQGVV